MVRSTFIYPGKVTNTHSRVRAHLEGMRNRGAIIRIAGLGQGKREAANAVEPFWKIGIFQCPSFQLYMHRRQRSQSPESDVYLKVFLCATLRNRD